MENENINQTNSNIDKDYFLFAKFIIGLKGIPYSTEALLVNNVPNNSLDILYSINSAKKVIKLPKNCIKDISFNPEINMQTNSNLLNSNELKKDLLFSSKFGSDCLGQLISNEMINIIILDAEGIHDKYNVNVCYRINIDITYDNHEVKFILNSNNTPESFIKKIK